MAKGVFHKPSEQVEASSGGNGGGVKTAGAMKIWQVGIEEKSWKMRNKNVKCKIMSGVHNRRD